MTRTETTPGVGPEGAAAVRPLLHAMWGSVAPSWGERAAYVDERGAAVADRMLASATVHGGDRVLELACGPGGVGIAAAELVGLSGEVVISDVSEAMVAIAVARAEEAGLTNVRHRVLDIEQIDEADGSFDVVLCREALMLVPDPALAAREIARVLRTGGHLAVAVWGAPADNPWLAVLLDAVGTHLGMPVPPPGIPGPFSLAELEALEQVLSDAGFSDVAIQEVASPLTVPSFDAWWSTVPPLAGPVSQVLASLPDDALEAIRTRARESLMPYDRGDGLVVPGVSLVAAGHKP